MIVLDASTVIELLFGNRAVAARLARSPDSLAAPHLLDVEVASVIRRLSLINKVSQTRGEEALADLAELDIDRYPHDALLPRAWELRENFTAYDAVYLALAEALRAPLLTLDQKIFRSSGHRARVELAAEAAAVTSRRISRPSI